MARRTGDRNRDFQEKRGQILAAVQRRLCQADAARVSLSELAQAAGVSLSSLRHHLGGRQELLRAVLEELGRQGEPYTRRIAAPPTKPLRGSLAEVLDGVRRALLDFGVLDTHALGLAAGLRDSVIGPAYLRAMLEPTLRCVEQRLQHHVERGDLPPCDVRVAALALLSPLLLGALHQGGPQGGGLGGKEVRPLDLRQLCDEILARWLRAYGPPAGEAAGP